jgi:hypothetical protein
MVDSTASPWTEPSQFWVLNPGMNIDTCFDLGVSRFVFTQRTYQFKRNMAIDPRKQIDFYSRGRPWKAMLVEYDGRVSLVFDSKKGWNRPVAVYPSWSYKNNTSDSLRRLCRAYPEPGQIVGKFWGDSEQYRAVQGQDKVILIRNPPKDRLQWQEMMGFVSNMRRYHDVRFHFHGGKSMERTVGQSVDAFDHPVTISWVDGEPTLLMPNGQIAETNRTVINKHDHWAKLIGESLAEFRRLKDRKEKAKFAYRFNLKSLIWAERNQEKLYAFQGRRLDDNEVDYESSDADWAPVLRNYRPRLVDIGDKWLCDTCTVAHRCPYSRAGAICIVDGTEGQKLSEKFRSRKTTDIIDGISALLGANTERLEKALVTEQAIADETGQYRLSPQVTTLANAIFDRAIQMARLLDPSIAGQMANGRVNVGIVNANAGAVAQATPQEIMAGVANKLEQFGIPLAEATIEQVEAVMRGDDPPVYPNAIDVVPDGSHG